MFIQGYHSVLWLQLLSQLSIIILCRPTKSNINSWVSDAALEASCNACAILRALQKQRRIAQRWLVVRVFLLDTWDGITHMGVFHVRYTDLAPANFLLTGSITIPGWRDSLLHNFCPRHAYVI